MESNLSAHLASNQPLSVKLETELANKFGRRPLLELVVLYASNQKVARYALSVMERFLSKGIDVVLHTTPRNTKKLKNTSKLRDIESHHLSEIIIGSIADFLIVIGDRNMKNESVQAKKKGKLVEMKIPELLGLMSKAWPPNSQKITDRVNAMSNMITEELIYHYTGLKKLSERMEALRLSEKELRLWTMPLTKEQCTNADQEMAAKSTSFQKHAIRLHRNLVEASDTLSDLIQFTNNSDKSNSRGTLRDTSYAPNAARLEHVTIAPLVQLKLWKSIKGNADEIQKTIMVIDHLELSLWNDYVATASTTSPPRQLGRTIEEREPTMQIKVFDGCSIEVPLLAKSKELDELVARSTSLSKRAIKRMKKVEERKIGDRLGQTIDIKFPAPTTTPRNAWTGRTDGRAFAATPSNFVPIHQAKFPELARPDIGAHDVSSGSSSESDYVDSSEDESYESDDEPDAVPQVRVSENSDPEMAVPPSSVLPHEQAPIELIRLQNSTSKYSQNYSVSPERVSTGSVTAILQRPKPDEPVHTVKKIDFEEELAHLGKEEPDQTDPSTTQFLKDLRKYYLKKEELDPASAFDWILTDPRRASKTEPEIPQIDSYHSFETSEEERERIMWIKDRSANTYDQVIQAVRAANYQQRMLPEKFFGDQRNPRDQSYFANSKPTRSETRSDPDLGTCQNCAKPRNPIGVETRSVRTAACAGSKIVFSSARSSSAEIQRMPSSPKATGKCNHEPLWTKEEFVALNLQSLVIESDPNAIIEICENKNSLLDVTSEHGPQTTSSRKNVLDFFGPAPTSRASKHPLFLQGPQPKPIARKAFSAVDLNASDSNQ